MKFIGLSFMLFSLMLGSAPAADLLDLEQESLQIPDTHETGDYRSNTLDNLDDYVSVPEFKVAENAGGGQRITFTVESTLADPVDEIHIFITDRQARSFHHLRPEEIAPGRYVFEFHPRNRGRHRTEIVLLYSWGEARISRDFEVAKAAPPGSPPDEDADRYSVRLRTFPKDIYADHVATFVYEITHQGVPVNDLEPIDGHDMILASWNLGWFGSFEEFVFAQSRQNLGGPEVGVSLVFEKPGKHVVFAQFRHRGEIRTVDTHVHVRLERTFHDNSLDDDDRTF